MSQTFDLLEELAALACPGGGWGYTADQPPHLEPTCLALLALSRQPQRFAAAIESGRNSLRPCAADDGMYRLGRCRPEAIWPTALVLFTQATLGESGDSLQQTAAALLACKGRQGDSQDSDISDIDDHLIGWPWAEGNFSWVEPTAWACLALRRIGQERHPRVEEGLRLLRDRILKEGGVNYGNRRIFGISLEPIPTPTALMLLALQGRHDEPSLAASVEYLRRTAENSDDLEHLCWARLALDVYSDRPGVSETVAALGERIRAAHAARLATPWLRPAPLRQALTALAFDIEHGNPFRLPSRDREGAVMPTAPSRSRLGKRPLIARIKSKIRGVAVHALTQLRQLDPESAVHIAPVSDYNADLADVLSRQYEHFRTRVPLAGKRVVLKPNLVEYHRDKVINTHPHVVAAVIELCRRESAAEVLVAEGPGHWRNVEHLVSASGLGDVLRHYKTPFIDLNHDEPCKRPNLGRLTGLEHLYLSQTVATADVLISLPKLKTHHWAVATLSLKNLFGTMPGICYGWPKNELHWRGIDNSIVDIAATRTPDLAIVDGILGMEGDGPLNGTAKAMGVLVMGDDPVAVDATCCRLMQLDPDRVGYLVLAQRKKLGLLASAHIQQLGDSIEQRAQPFDTVPHFRALSLRAADVAATTPVPVP
ncbi:MAG TPA: DUF362 domain-containing protein [Gemmataceae bacterium]|nr:DUF362 domain-containing protein [Gemmataceae bacterium]